jgi:hypothetical protein
MVVYFSYSWRKRAFEIIYRIDLAADANSASFPGFIDRKIIGRFIRKQIHVQHE